MVLRVSPHKKREQGEQGAERRQHTARIKPETEDRKEMQPNKQKS